MRFALLSALKDFRRMRRDPLAMLTWAGMPFLIGLLVFAFFGREQPKPHGLVIISDQDKTFLSALILHAYTQDKLGDIFSVQQAPLDEGRRIIASGDASALVIIPKGFSRAVLGKQDAKLELITNPTQSILPGIVESVTSLLVEGVWRLQQLGLMDYSNYSEEPSDQEIAENSIRMRREISKMQNYLNPPVIKVNVSRIATNPGHDRENFAAMMLQSMTFMAALFFINSLMGDLWKEKIGGTLRRLVVTPQSMTGFLGGKIMYTFTIFLALGIVAILTGKFLIGGIIHNPILAALWLSTFGSAMFLIFAILNTFVKNQRAASTITNLFVMTLAMIGGSFFPFDLMPHSLARIGKLTPNGWALLQYKEILAGQRSAADLAGSFIIASIVLITLLILASWRLRRKFIL